MDDKKLTYHEKYTSVEIGKLWATYTGNTLSKCILSYFLNNVEDPEIEKMVKQGLDLGNSFLTKIKDFFKEEDFATPIGFTEKDVDVNAPRLFTDEYYLYYLRYASKTALSLYSIAIPLMVEKDVREFFIDSCAATIELVNNANDLLIEKGLLKKPPMIPIPDKVDFLKKQNYLNGFFGNVRPLSALEVTHLYDIIDTNVISKVLLIGFSQVAKNDQVRNFFLRGKNLTQKHIAVCSNHLQKENLPSPSLLDDFVTTSTVSPFADKVMLAHKIEMFSMKIRAYGNAMSLGARRDLGAMYGKLLLDIGLYVEDGANIMINHGWMEEPPKAASRDELSKHRD
ncbi:DUF3231 family protein [Mesobacillus maritimus]|uniref:DUF3231 family protein n=1 Tax=Mesobacillus maritimus TaxID=1643336 RepID=UPI00203F52C1|nr:DUF3231 family protein [Mesobacillus maritimus]MCM3670650.1 DUF3231 family protein [Mesobacillus maritimus]